MIIKYDLKKMLAEIEEDKKNAVKPKTEKQKASQEDIMKLFKAGQGKK